MRSFCCRSVFAGVHSGRETNATQVGFANAMCIDYSRMIAVKVLVFGTYGGIEVATYQNEH
jgi:hypothetical protein